MITDNAPIALEQPSQQTARTPVSIWAVACASALSAALVAVYAIVPDHRVHGLALCVALAAFVVPLAVIDIRTLRLPNRIVAPLAAFGLVQVGGVAIMTRDPSRLLIALATAGIVGVVYLSLGLAGWFGLGDGKFAAATALTVAVYAGWLTLYVAALAIVIAVVERLVLLLLGRARSSGRAHGPAIAVAALTILIAIIFSTT